ncbi:hypothetical protein BOX15_Mlig023136g1 [Macrostomum lignano]|uniref:DNA replication licensing factor MCM3 n=1 Tax=Macrostomum lignano TaxID=282301 RepID=A0A267E1K5_9PLAT|nr:hypothetical protein BOX15_Mlig023136g1 [Macrostomum lignano]
MIESDKCRLILNINDLRVKNANRCSSLLKNAFDELIAAQSALRKCVINANTEFGKSKEHFFVGVEGSFGANHLTPRTLSASHLKQMVCIEGIVTKCSLVHPKIVRSVHYCPATRKTMERQYTDLTSLEPFPSSGAYPTKDDDGNLLETEYGLSRYADHQTFTVQEMPEKSPAGQLPRALDVIADNDLVDSCKPGDRVQVIGQYRCLPSKKAGYTSATFRTVLIANHLLPVGRTEASLAFTQEDLRLIRDFSRQADPFQQLAKSIAPSIHGHEWVKRAILCLLLGGVERHLENGSRIRGDVNVMLIGDPSVAKSQFLRYVLHCAPRAIATTGRGTSGVGLTAAVTTDSESGERQLEAGAMVLADRGVVCIDEFDKMSDIDRTAIHEVMEQGRVTIAKAGIQARLNARCSVLAAANPVYGRYDPYKSPMDNIGMQDSLLSRFDLLFVVLDRMDPASDRMIAEHVLRMHKYRSPLEQEGEALPLQAQHDQLSTVQPSKEPTDQQQQQQQSQQKRTDVYEQHNPVLHGPMSGAGGGGRQRRSDRQVTLAFLQKYVQAARAHSPSLGRDAADFLADRYAELRSEEARQAAGVQRTQPVTARTLETLIRLATAHAKARFSKEVKRRDAEAAADLVSYAIFKEVLQRPTRAGKRAARDAADAEAAGSDESDEDDESGDDQEEEEAEGDAGEAEGGRRAAPRRKRIRRAAADAPADVAAPAAASADVLSDRSNAPLSADRLRDIRQLVSRAFQAARADSLPLSRLLPEVAKQAGCSEAEVRAALDRLHADNRLMVAGSDVWLL